MIRDIFRFIIAWINGEYAELHIDITWYFGWWDIGAITVIIGLVGYILFQWIF